MEKTHILIIKNRTQFLTLAQAGAIFAGITASTTDTVEIKDQKTFSFTKCYKREIQLRPLDEREIIIYNQEESVQARLLLFIAAREEQKITTSAEQLKQFLTNL